jgi:hypothetical protein
MPSSSSSTAALVHEGEDIFGRMVGISTETLLPNKKIAMHESGKRGCRVIMSHFIKQASLSLALPFSL